jgi:hypothetical protein
MQPKTSLNTLYLASSAYTSPSVDIIVGEDPEGRTIIGEQITILAKGQTPWMFIRPFKVDGSQVYFWSLKSNERYDGMKRVADASGYKLDTKTGQAYSIDGSYDSNGKISQQFKIGIPYQFNFNPSNLGPIRVRRSQIHSAEGETL